MPTYEQAFGIVRPGGVISRVGVPQYEEAPVGFDSLFGPNIRLTGGPAPVRAYSEKLMPDILDGSIEPRNVSTPPATSTVSRPATRTTARASKVVIKP